MLKINVKSIIKPNLLKSDEEKFVYDIKNNFFNYLEKKCVNYLEKFIENVFCYIIVGYELNGNSEITYEDKRKKLYFLNNPHNINYEQDTKLTTFRAHIDLFVRDLSIPYDFTARNIGFIVSFNKEPEELLKSIAQKTKDLLNEENLVFFVPSEPKFGFEQIILNQDLLNEISKTLSILKYRHIIYDEWGFNEVEPSPKAILNFYGPSGTGKTMTAHAIAKHLGLKILSLNYADIESKFVGDAPKNLVRAFEIAKKENALIFFDEADSFLGKRITSVSTSSDQAVNSLRSQMLILLDNFPGIVIFATNLISNYDRAFESRIFKHLKFDLPDKEQRIKLIKKMIPTRVPLDQLIEEQLVDLADISEGFSGRDIKNCILNALTTVVCEDRKLVTFKDLQDSFKKYEENKKHLEKEFNPQKLDPNKKKDLEEKIMMNLRKETNRDEFRRNLLKIGLHAIFIDGIAQDEKKALFYKLTKEFNLQLEIPKSKEDLTPLVDLISKLNSHEEKVASIDFVIHLIASDGHVTQEEFEFVTNFLDLLNVPPSLKVDTIKFLTSLASAQSQWIKIKKDFNILCNKS